MQVGMNIATRHPFDGARASLEIAEAAQVDSVWAPDHLLGTFHPALWPDMPLASIATSPDAFYDPFVCLGAMTTSSRLAMGVCVTDTARRRAPDVVRTALTLHHLCAGGFNLGIGAGEAENLVPFGYDFATPVTRAEEFLHELRSLLDSGVMPGDLHGHAGLPTRRDDLGAPPVWIAGHAPRMLRLTGEYGDGWLPAWPMTPAVYGEKRAVIAEHAARAGRSAPRSGLHVVVAFGASRDAVAELMDREPLSKLTALLCPSELWAAYGLEHPSGPACRGLVDLLLDELDPEELRALAPTIPVELLEHFWFLGNASELTERIAAYAEHGLEYVVLANATGYAGGLHEIAANAHQFAELRRALALF